MKGWHATAWSPVGPKHRAIAWTCSTDSRLVVRHCGHPTANYPYWIEIAGVSQLNTLGTFRNLDPAQAAAVKAADSLPR